MSKLSISTRTVKHITSLFSALHSTTFIQRVSHRNMSLVADQPKPTSHTQLQENFEERAKKFFDFDEVEADVFRSSTLSTSRQGSKKAAYGGLIFSQALAAAENTVNEEMKPHAMHSFFIMSVDTTIPIQYHVKRVRDGRSFCTRTVEGIQNGKIVFIMQVSFHVVENDAIVHQHKMPIVPNWENLMSLNVVPWLKEKIKSGEIRVPPTIQFELDTHESKASTRNDLFELLPANIANYYCYLPNESNTFYYWMKTRGKIGDSEKLHRYLVTYNTDATMATSILRPHHINNFEPSMILSLDHNIWMHKHIMRADGWLLYENTSTAAGRGRGFATGRLWHPDGTLLLSSTQEVLLRSKSSVSRL